MFKYKYSIPPLYQIRVNKSTGFYEPVESHGEVGTNPPWGAAGFKFWLCVTTCFSRFVVISLSIFSNVCNTNLKKFENISFPFFIRTTFLI